MDRPAMPPPMMMMCIDGVKQRWPCWSWFVRSKCIMYAADLQNPALWENEDANCGILPSGSCDAGPRGKGESW